MDKLTAIKIKYQNGTYSDQIPIGALAQNVEWDDQYGLMDIIGNVDMSADGSIQTQIDNILAEKGAVNGIAELDSTGKVPSSQLPSYVDDVLEYDSYNQFPAIGESGKIYVDKTTNKTYRWGGSSYVEISPSLALGETSSTAYRGDRGKIAYDHSQKTSGNPHNVTKSDVGLGNVGNFKAVSTVASQGLSSTEQSNARANISAGTSSFSGSYNDLSNKPTLGTASSKDVASSGNASTSQVVMGNDTRLSDSRNAKDVYSWAKASSKPSYTASEVGLGNVGNFKAVSTVANQGLSSTEQSNARANIGAGIGTVASVATGIGLTGGTITGSGTLKAKLKSETARTIDALSVDTSTSKLYPVVADKSGYLAVGVPWTDNDTKNTAGSTDTSSKIFLIGATSQAANPQTYSHDTAYVGTDGQLYSGGNKVLTSHQTIKQDGVSGATANRFGVCSTGAATAAKTVSITSGTFNLESGAQVSVKFSNTNSANNPTLNVNSTGAKNIFVNGSQITTGSEKSLLKGTVSFVYDGTQWHLIGGGSDSPPVVELTQAQYDALSEAEQNNGTIYYIIDGVGEISASDVVYDNTQSGLEATNVQAAIDKTRNAQDRNQYKEITTDFNNGTFSNNLKLYNPGNYIKKVYNNTTYVAVLADLNTFRGTQNLNAVVNQDHWVAIVLGFAVGQINSTNTTENGFTGSAMNTWLKGDCATIVKAAFGTNHLIAHDCLLTTDTYNANTANTFGFSWAWESGHYAMLMSEEQIYGCKAWSLKTGFDPGEAWRQLKIFQNEPYMYVLGKDYGQSNNNFNSNSCWLRNISAGVPGAGFCFATRLGLANYNGASHSYGRFPIIMLK